MTATITLGLNALPPEVLSDSDYGEGPSIQFRQGAFTVVLTAALLKHMAEMQRFGGFRA